MEFVADGVKKMLEDFSVEMYLLSQNKNTMCSCVDFATKQADPECVKCLGTGHQVFISRITGVHQVLRKALAGITPRISTSEDVFYIDAKYSIETDNIIVTESKAYVMLDAIPQILTDIVYTSCKAEPKKAKADVFMKMFKDIVGEQ